MSCFLVCLFVVSASAQLQNAYPTPVYPVTDEGGLGRVFDGIGGLSGGGATSKLLVNYPDKQRSEILDYLFKPNFGASLHILKVEIGGDVQSTEGTEASHMHNSWEENYNRGYEWWLMKEAKTRNPSIKLYGLPWGFPGWLGTENITNPYANPSRLADYVVKWVQGAQRVHGLTIDFVGIWNERPYDSTYIKTLRKALDANGFSHTRVVANDDKWVIAEDILTDPDLAAAVDYIGCHYPGTFSADAPMKTGKQLWASEESDRDARSFGRMKWARSVNQNYVNGYMTSSISWNLIASYYTALPYPYQGLMTALQPWSGYYVVDITIWITAHTTQFTEVGWRYLGHGSGVGHLESGGSYVTLVSPDLQHLTIVVETTRLGDALDQDAAFALAGNFSKVKELHVWCSTMDASGEDGSMFQKRPALKAVNGTFKLHLPVNALCTLTTLTTGNKGQHHRPPSAKPFPLPYQDGFQGYEEFQEPYYLVPQSGSYEVMEVAPNVKVMRQTVLQHPVSWCSEAEDADATLNVAGDSNWRDIEVSVDFSLASVNSSSGVFLGTRIQGGGCRNTSTALGVFFSIIPKTNTYFLSLDISHKNTFASGALPFPLQMWNSASLRVQGATVEAIYNGTLLISSPLPAEAPKKGFVGLGTTSWGIADFDNFGINAI